MMKSSVRRKVLLIFCLFDNKIVIVVIVMKKDKRKCINQQVAGENTTVQAKHSKSLKLVRNK